MNSLISVADAARLIQTGDPLSIAGEEACLDQLPRGNWVGGTIPYFMSAAGGLKSKDQVLVTTLPKGSAVSFAHYDPDDLVGVVRDAPANGFGLVIIPAFSQAHSRFAEECRSYPDAFLKPTIGWISGIDLDNLGKQTPKVYDGTTGRKHAEGAVVARVTLPADQLASIELVNIFERDNVDVIRFAKTGFSASECTVNGQARQLADYVKERGNGDGKLPLVGDFEGADVNVSFQSIDYATGEVKFYAPVLSDVTYWIAKPVGNYAKTFRDELRAMEGKQIVFACNCILNYLYGELKGKNVSDKQTPMTFGEIGYQLLNQTFTALRID